ncbi:MAG TPA: hypothetical protein PLZ36_01055 [Armatimonadota bacterium]|nr:hypothetical protein [Armatimonadota bacterium]HOS44416.1 hypothetical protein [Armatimonadota bacterium]
MKKQHVEILALVVLLLVLVVAVVMTLNPAPKRAAAKTPNPEDPRTTNMQAATATVEVAWADPERVRQAIPTVSGGRDPFMDLLPPPKGPGPTPVTTNETPPPIPVKIDTRFLSSATLPDVGEVAPLAVDPPKILVHGIIFGSTRDTTYVALSADGKPYTLLTGEKLPDAQGNLWTVTAITPTSVTLSKGTQSARFRLSGGS